jgi:hypothetical protein
MTFEVGKELFPLLDQSRVGVRRRFPRGQGDGDGCGEVERTQSGALGCFLQLERPAQVPVGAAMHFGPVLPRSIGSHGLPQFGPTAASHRIIIGAHDKGVGCHSVAECQAERYRGHSLPAPSRPAAASAPGRCLGLAGARFSCVGCNANPAPSGLGCRLALADGRVRPRAG